MFFTRQNGRFLERQTQRDAGDVHFCERKAAVAKRLAQILVADEVAVHVLQGPIGVQAVVGRHAKDPVDQALPLQRDRHGRGHHVRRHDGARVNFIDLLAQHILQQIQLRHALEQVAGGAAPPGQVVDARSEHNRGGLEVIQDSGQVFDHFGKGIGDGNGRFRRSLGQRVRQRLGRDLVTRPD
jgi:hypothetical protein